MAIAWRVRFPAATMSLIQTNKNFSFTEYGSEEKALQAAVSFRNMELDRAIQKVSKSFANNLIIFKDSYKFFELDSKI